MYISVQMEQVSPSIVYNPVQLKVCYHISDYAFVEPN